MAYDRVRDRVVLFGGATAGAQPMDDTWEFDGSHWQRMGVLPPPRTHQHAMVYDESRGVTVVVTTAFGDRTTWDWDGTKWTQEPIPGLPPRYGFAMAYDTTRQRMYWHAGYGTLRASAVSDFWGKTGGEPWVLLASQTTIPGRYRHAMAYDAKRDRLVVYGGEDSGFGGLGDTWEWDGAQWTQVFPTISPGLRSGARLVYHEGLGTCVLYGGNTDGGPTNQTWLYDGETWALSQAAGPAARSLHGMAYDTKRTRVVMYGGVVDVGVVADDTWVLVTVPAPCRANCTGDATPGGAPKLDIQDFTCFQNAFALADLTKADIGGPLSPCGTPDGKLDIADFTCFQNLFALGCK